MRTYFAIATLSIMFGAFCGAEAQEDEAPQADQASLATNVAAFETGAVLLNYTSEYGGRGSDQWIALNLIDGTPNKGWSSAENQPAPNEFIVELRGIAEITAVVMDASGVEEPAYPGISATAGELWASTESADTGYAKIWSGSMDAATRMEFALDTPAKARWLKFIVTGNGGYTRYTELMEFEALGSFTGDAPETEAVAATYDTNWGPFYLVYTDGELRGCYDHDGGRFNGHLNDQFINLEWSENGGTQRGSAILAITSSGSAFSGYWYEAGSVQGTWLGTRLPDAEPPTCAANLALVATSTVETALNEAGKAVLYGIYFDYDSDTLKAESEPALNSLKNWLEKNPGKVLALSGHTDSDGSESYNLDLSQRRANAVVAWLTDKGIPAASLSATGYGESQPVAENSSAQGKSLNRRVEAEVKG